MTADRPFYIYCHTSPSGKRYIGQTSVEPKKRWNNGLGYLNCTYFKHAIDKYGWDNIRHDIICVVHSEKLAHLFEQHYIQKYDTFNHDKGYNLTLGGEGTLGHKLSDEAKRRIGEANTGNFWDEERKRRRSEMISGEGNPMYGHHHTKEVCEKMSRERKGVPLKPEHREKVTRAILKQVEKQKMPVDQYDLQGNYIATYPSLSDAARSVGVTESSIHRCCSGMGNTAAGYKWTYHGEELIERVRKATGKRGASGVPIVQCDLEGNEVARFSSMMEAGEKTGLNRNKISECCHGGLQEYAGYKWSFGSETKSRGHKIPVVQLDTDGNEIARFDTFEEASAATGIQRNRISACCHGNAKLAGGFIWKYANDNELNRKLGQPNEVIQFDMNGNELARYKSLSEAMASTGHDRHRIVECCKGERESYRGFTWRYKEAA